MLHQQRPKDMVCTWFYQTLSKYHRVKHVLVSTKHSAQTVPELEYRSIFQSGLSMVKSNSAQAVMI